MKMLDNIREKFFIEFSSQFFNQNSPYYIKKLPTEKTDGGFFVKVDENFNLGVRPDVCTVYHVLGFNFNMIIKDFTTLYDFMMMSGDDRDDYTFITSYYFSSDLVFSRMTFDESKNMFERSIKEIHRSNKEILDNIVEEIINEFYEGNLNFDKVSYIENDKIFFKADKGDIEFKIAIHSVPTIKDGNTYYDVRLILNDRLVYDTNVPLYGDCYDLKKLFKTDGKTHRLISHYDFLKTLDLEVTNDIDKRFKENTPLNKFKNETFTPNEKIEKEIKSAAFSLARKMMESGMKSYRGSNASIEIDFDKALHTVIVKYSIYGKVYKFKINDKKLIDSFLIYNSLSSEEKLLKHWLDNSSIKKNLVFQNVVKPVKEYKNVTQKIRECSETDIELLITDICRHICDAVEFVEKDENGSYWITTKDEDDEFSLFTLELNDGNYVIYFHEFFCRYSGYSEYLKDMDLEIEDKEKILLKHINLLINNGKNS